MTSVINGVDYGPLACLVGRWQGDKGMDVAPEPDGKEDNPFYETLVFTASGDLSNAKEQKLAIVSYHQEVKRKSNDEVFHDQTGYWLWDASNKTVMQTLTIPRGLCLLAGSRYNGATEAATITLQVRAAADDKDWGIVQSPFLQRKAKTLEFTHRIEIKGNTLRYHESTLLDIYGSVFDHTDGNTLIRVG